MEKTAETSYSKIEVCRNCKGDGRFMEPECHRICDVCGGSGMVRKYVEVKITIKPHKRK